MIFGMTEKGIKQKVIVQALVRIAGATLLLRRKGGLYELPGGALEGNEQPEDALRRHLKNDTGLLVTQPLLLKDAFSMKSRVDNHNNYVLIVYSVEYDEPPRIILGHSYDSYVLQNSQQLDASLLRDSAQVVFGVYDGTSDMKYESSNSSTVDKKATKYIIYTDGGSRGNPGPSASAYVIYDSRGNLLEQAGEYLGVTTNNQAEYQAVLLGLERASALRLESVEFRLDSMLVVNQINGLYEVKNKEFWPIHGRIKALLVDMPLVRFKHIPRELNTVADGLVNTVLDKHDRL